MARLPAFILTIFVAFAAEAAIPAPTNLDFETGAPGEVPKAWASPTAAFGYKAELTAEAPKQGKQAVRLSGAPQRLEPDRPQFGNVMQTVDATPYRGKRIRFRGAVRVEGTGARAGLWMRVDRPGKKVGFFDNMQDRPIVSREWAYYEIVGNIEADAEVLNFGMLMPGEGSAWLDDVTIETLGDVVMRSAAPRPLTPRGLENLAAFARMYGVVRYFHASDEAAAADWDAIAVEGSERVESAKDAAELAARLIEIFEPVAPSIHITRAPAAAGAPAELTLTGTRILAWEHHGHGLGQPRGGIYGSDRIEIPQPLAPAQVDLGGVSITVPLAVRADATGTLPRATRKAPAPSTALYSGNDRATRIGGVVTLWNAVHHFYPYFDVVNVDWAKELRTALQAAATDRDEDAFRRTLQRMLVAIDDGHGSARGGGQLFSGTLPLLWRVIEDKLIVTAVDPAATGVAAGDEAVTINGKPAMAALREEEARVSGSPQWKRWMALFHLTNVADSSKVVLTVRTAAEPPREVTLTPAVRPEPLREKRPEKLTELKPGIWYIDLGRISDEDFNAALEKLAGAKGLVFDLRGYPRVSTKPLQHLIDESVQSARWNVPVLRRPDREGLEWNARRWTLEPLKPRLTKNVAFLTDGRAISYSETWMGIVEAYKLGTIVGETTAATNGNIVTIRLPGGYHAVFTGMRVLKHDESRHHGIGIVPTVPVTPTRAGVRAGRDEQLEKALEVVGR